MYAILIQGSRVMSLKKKAASALMAVFPTPESFARFGANKDNKEAIRSFCIFAFKNGIIGFDDEEELKNFIHSNTDYEERNLPPVNLTFESFFEQKEDLLKLKLSGRALTDRINALITEHNIKLPKVSNAMLSRFKKEPADTPHKENVLRSIAFWLGYMRVDLAAKWNFETLCALCSYGRSTVEYREGVRIGFALFGRGDVIDHEIVGWLKKTLKGYIEQSINRFSYGRWGKVRSHDITTLFLDFPKEETVNNPEAYRQCLRSALSLVHQISIRWALSKHQTQNRFLSIGIAVGDFAQLESRLIAILNAKLPEDPVIRLTDYARQCILINSIRVLPCNTPAEITLINGETLTIWWVVGFWSALYFDFIPELMEDEILRNDAFASKRLASSLWSAVSKEKESNRKNEPDAISAFFKFPSNSLLGIEIAKTLFYQRRFWEAIEILKILLSLNPTDLVARTMRMALLSNLALAAPTYGIAKGLFTKAYNEADFIKENCLYQTEDFYCEHALLYLTQAMHALRYLREGNSDVEGEDNPQKIKPLIFDSLEKADTLFGKGEMVSPTGIRSYYMQNSVRILKAILKTDDQVFVDAERPVDSTSHIIRSSTRDFQWQIGYFGDKEPLNPSDILKAKIFRSDYLSHRDSIALQAYRPAFFFCTAVAWWDMFPVRTIANARITMLALKKALEMGRTIREMDFCIYSLTRSYGEMVTADTFIQHVKRSIQMIEEQTGGDLFRRNDSEIIEPKESDPMTLLMTLNF